MSNRLNCVQVCISATEGQLNSAGWNNGVKTWYFRSSHNQSTQDLRPWNHVPMMCSPRVLVLYLYIAFQSLINTRNAYRYINHWDRYPTKSSYPDSVRQTSSLMYYHISATYQLSDVLSYLLYVSATQLFRFFNVFGFLWFFKCFWFF